LITCGEVERVEGSPGRFKVSIKKRPRYIDETRCTACGDCVEVCPVSLPSEYDQNMVTRKAIYKKYAQAIPSAYAVSKRGKAPCKIACPAHISVQGYIALVASGKYKEALELIKQENPLPAICGRVCHHPCESICTRGEVDEPVAIDFIKRFVADLDLNSRTRYIPEIEEKREEKVAIIGSGPAGLSCAYYLAIKGYKVTIYEKLPVPGGMLSVGIPEYRLPRDIIRAEIQVIKDMGVTINAGIEVGKDVSIAQFRKEGFKAVFLAIGAQECKRMGIEGEDLDGCYPGVDFLRDVNLGKEVKLGERVAVIGGGNVAMDSVRTALRLGAKEAFVLYRRTFEEMPANEEEIEECEEEGIEIHTLTSPKRIIGEKGRVKAIECLKMKLGDPDESGRRRPIPVQGSEFVIEVDNVIPAIGQESDWACLGPECACSLTEWGTMKVDPLTLQTDDPDIFAGGDAVTGPRTVIEAIEAGKQAAVSIDRFIKGLDLREGRERVWEEAKDIPRDEYVPRPRTRMPRLSPEKRICNFKEVQLGFTEEQVLSEARRCLNCGICSECYQCVDACGAKAVTIETHDRHEETIELEVGSIILSGGLKTFDPSAYKAYAYSRHPNIVTSMEFERILSASGPTAGHLVRPSDKKVPQKIAWVQCVGSRGVHHGDNGYCSSVCCMYAIKEALIAKEHEGRALDCAIFYMDIRTHGKDFERYYNDARERHGVRFIRSRVPAIEPDPEGDDLIVTYVDEKEKVVQETFEMVVLSVGLESSQEALDVAGRLDVSLTEGGFYRTETFSPVSSSRDGVFVCGTCQGPKDIPQSVIEAGAASAEAGAILSESRSTLTAKQPPIQEKNIQGQSPRIGVFLCHCGVNISSVIDMEELKEYAASLPYVEYVTDNLYTCSQDTQEIMARIISEEDLNRIVVAACTPKTHEPLFQDTLASAGLNKYLLEMTNIRNQDSWVHRDNPAEATEKAKDLVRMAVAKVALMEPLEETTLDINQRALVIGGGIAGMAAARNLSRQGYQVCLVERHSELGGNALELFRTWRGEDIQGKVRSLIQSVETDPNIEVYKGREIISVEGFVGNFRTTLGTVSTAGETREIEHGVAIIATGAEELKPREYLYGKDPRVVTHLELDRMFKEDGARIKALETVVFIQCVGSREPDKPYCSRVCCTHAIESALFIKELNPEADVYILYRDLRTYGEREYLYREARLKGIMFIAFSLDEKPQVISKKNGLEVRFSDPILGEDLLIRADLVALASAIISRGQEDLARFFKVPLNEDGFFVEAHAKLGPSEFATEGVFLCGMAHYPKSIDESIAQALAASSRASTLLARKSLRVSGTVATVDQVQCSHCGVCVSICPYSAPRMVEEGRDRAFIEINPALCKGCGLCVSSCRSGAVNLMGLSEEQVITMINEI